MSSTQPLAAGLAGAPVRRQRGFTLIELLTVIAIIAILAGILIPTVGAVQRQARVAQSKALFQQLATAAISYKSEYGYFPTFGQAYGGSGDHVVNLSDDPEAVYQTLTGYNSDGSPLTGQAAALNPKRIGFFSFATSNFYIDPATGERSTEPILADAFNNRDIVMVMDQDGNGLLSADSFSQPVQVEDTGESVTVSSEIPGAGLRQPVAVYSGGTGPNNPVLSWD
ncbi:MAG: type II secretion system protein [Opitutales bacterium]